ncbi:MAG: ATP-binding protein, partial [Phycisphaeraceae bacterium]
MAITSPITLVVIDDDPLQLRLMDKRLRQPHPKLSVGQVFTYTEAGEALANMPAQGPVAILCDFDMPDSNGLDWMADLIRQDVGPVLMLTATGDERVASSAFRLGASDYLLKSDVATDIGKLKHAIADALRRYDMGKRNKQFARELKLANQKLYERNDVLTEMTRTAHRFVDNVAHDFRTPLTVIQEFVSILTDGLGGEVNEKQAEFLSYIDASARDLNAMVDDFLDSSKLKAQKLRVHRSVTSVQRIFERARPTLETRAQSKSIKVVYEVDDALPEVFADSEKIGRVLINLVINAIKFSPEESTIHVTADLANDGEVLVAVRDEGIGLSEDELPKVCERFSQVTDPRRSVAKGFGLGLNIARD